MTTHEYYTKLMGYYDELACLKPLPSCVCNKCDCGLALKLTKDREKRCFISILLPLTTIFMVLCVPIYWYNNPLLTSIERTKLWCRKNNHGQPLVTKGWVKMHAFVVQSDRGRNRFPQVDKTKLVCAHCKQQGHKINTCFKIHGNPEWYEERLRARNAHNDGVADGGAGLSPQLLG